jgi:hypothetical protein
MRKIRDVLRLSAEGLSERRIGASLGIGHSGVGDTIRRARDAGLSWPLAGKVSDEELERRLYRKPATNVNIATGMTPTMRPLPDWSYIHRDIFDIDDTFDAAHGGQQLTFWNAHHDERGFAPMHVYHAASGLPVATIPEKSSVHSQGI